MWVMEDEFTTNEGMWAAWNLGRLVFVDRKIGGSDDGTETL